MDKRLNLLKEAWKLFESAESAEFDKKLIQASRKGNAEVVKQLLAAGADVHAEGDLALRYASNNGHSEVVKLLLAAGADVHAWDDSALQLASKEGHSEVVKLLLAAGADVHAIDDLALRWANKEGHLEIVKQLLAAGADVHADDDSTLRWASKEGHSEVVKLLIAAGADVHADNDSALRIASKEGHSEVVKLLIAAGADIHAVGNSALRFASIKGQIEVVKLLLAAGANVHDLALQRASENGHSEVVKLLIAAGADVHADDDLALQYASSNGHSEVVKLLLAAVDPIALKIKDGTNFNFIEDQPELLDDLKRSKYYDKFKKWYAIPRKMAKEYNENIGIFIHAVNHYSHAEYTLSQHEDSPELCVSTLDSNSVFRQAIILIGRGNIRLLFDFDCYSYVDETDEKLRRYATTEATEYDKLEVSDLETKNKEKRILKSVEEIGDNYYDEGFIHSYKTNWVGITGTETTNIEKIAEEYNLIYIPLSDFNKVVKNGRIDLLYDYLQGKHDDDYDYDYELEDIEDELMVASDDHLNESFSIDDIPEDK